MNCESANQANSAFHPPGVSKGVVIHGLRGWRPLKRQIWAARGACLQGRSPVCAWLRLRPVGCTPVLSVMSSATAFCSLWQYMSDGPLTLSKHNLLYLTGVRGSFIQAGVGISERLSVQGARREIRDAVLSSERRRRR